MSGEVEYPKLAIRLIGTSILAATSGYVVYKWYHTTIQSGDEFIPEGEHQSLLKHVGLRTKANVNYYRSKLFLKSYIFAHKLFKGKLKTNTTSALVATKIETPGSDLRKIFINTNNVFKTHPMRSVNIHTHPESAVNRSAMASWMEEVAIQNGFDPYHVSKSNSDQLGGSRYYYNAKDLTINFDDKPITKNTAFIFTDVDYYADMNSWLKLFKPILMYTIVPTQMSKRTSEYQYHFEGNDLVYTVCGGASYQHKLWVYEGDTLAVDTDDYLLTYSIEQRIVPEDVDHRYICLLPATKVPHPYSDLLSFKGEHLKRFRNDGFLYEPITDQLSIQASSKYHTVELRGIIYEAIKQRIACKTSPPIIADVERILRDAKVPDACTMAPILFNHVTSNIERNVILTTSLDNSFQPVVTGCLTNEDGSPMGESATSNLVFPGAAFPTNSEASDLATVQGRVIRPSNDKIPPRYYRTEANNFITQLLRSNVGTGQPWTIEQVRKEQDGAMQRARFNCTQHLMTTNGENKLTSFVKAEAYSTANDPRNITTMSPELTTMMSTFTYAFKEDILKKQHFYAPGKTTLEIVELLREQQGEDGMVCTDYNRFDGSISEWLQKHVGQAAYMRWLETKFKGEFLHWFDAVFIKKARTKHGVTYNPGWGTRSGSPITTDVNTLINAFVMFCAYRKMGYNIKDSFKKIGVTIGDDGIQKYIPGLIEALISVTKDLGLSLDVQHHPTGPYPFCGRLFIDPLTINDSHQDLKRTLPKLHLVAASPLSLEQRITNKAAGYLVTDAKTPIIGVWARKIMQITKLSPKHLTHEEAYKMNLAWPQTDEARLMEAACKQLDMTAAEIQSLEQMIEETQTLTDFPVLQEWTEDVKVTAIRFGIVNEPSGDHNSVSNQNVTTPKQRQTNQRFASTNRQITTSHARNQPRGAGNVIPPLAVPNRRRSRKPSRSPHQPSQTLPSQAQSARHADYRTRPERNTRGRTPACSGNQR
ncbi:reverse transcriptase [Rice Noda-like virus]|nr:reverse transcriptase [Rice Noda-like virus]